MGNVRPVGFYREKNREADAAAFNEFVNGGGVVHKIPDSETLNEIRAKRDRLEKSGKICLFSEKQIFEKGSK